MTNRRDSLQRKSTEREAGFRFFENGIRSLWVMSFVCQREDEEESSRSSKESSDNTLRLRKLEKMRNLKIISENGERQNKNERRAFFEESIELAQDEFPKMHTDD